MTWHLKELDKAELIDVHRQTRDSKSRDKIKAMLLIEKRGHELKQKYYYQLKNTVRRRQNHYPKRKNIGQFPSNNCPGCEGELSQEQRPVVSHYVVSELLSEAKESSTFHFNKIWADLFKKRCHCPVTSTGIYR